MQFQVGIYHEKFKLDQIQNGRPVATSNQPIPPEYTKITICRKLRSIISQFRCGVLPLEIETIQRKNGYVNYVPVV